VQVILVSPRAPSQDDSPVRQGECEFRGPFVATIMSQAWFSWCQTMTCLRHAPPTGPVSPPCAVVPANNASKDYDRNLLTASHSKRLVLPTVRAHCHTARPNATQGSAISGTLARLPTHPIDTLKARLQTMRADQLSSNGRGTSPLKLLATIAKTEGIRGLYRGLGVTVSIGPFAAMLYFTGYEVRGIRSELVRGHSALFVFRASLRAAPSLRGCFA